MSWSVSTNSTRVGEVRAELERQLEEIDWAQSNAPEEARTQAQRAVQAAVDLMKTITPEYLEPEENDFLVNVVLSGHANVGNREQEGWALPALSISITSVGRASSGTFDQSITRNDVP